MFDILSIVLYGLTAILLVVLGFFIYDLTSPLLIIVQKGLGLKVTKGRPKDGKWTIDGNLYVQDNSCAHPDRGWFFWRSIYVFDEGCPTGRKILFKKNEWLDGASLKKLIDKEYISGVITSMLGLLDGKKVMFYLLIVMVLSVINVLVVAVILLKTLGVLDSVGA